MVKLKAVWDQRAIIRNPLIASPEMRVKDAIAQMSTARMHDDSSHTCSNRTENHPGVCSAQARSSCVVVVESNQVIGLLTERDIVSLIAHQDGFAELAIHTVMTCPVTTLRESRLTDLSMALRLLQEHDTSHLPILDDQGHIVGLITLESLVPLLSEQSTETPTALELEKYHHATVALRNSEHRFRQITETTLEGIWILDAQNQTSYINPRMMEILGYNLDEMMGRSVFDFIDEEDWPAATRLIERRRQGVKEHHDFRFRTKTGGDVWVLLAASPLLDDSGNYMGALAMLTDISDRKRAETLLHKLISGTATATGADFFPVLVRQIADALKVAYVGIGELVEDTLQTLACWADDSLEPQLSLPFAQTPCEQTLRTGTFYCKSDVQAQFPRDPRLVVWGVESYLGTALYNSQGQPIGVLCIFDKHPLHRPAWLEEILHVFAARAAAELERKQAIQALERLKQDLEHQVEERTAALQASETRFRRLFDSNVVGMLFADFQGQITDANDCFLEMLGYSRLDLEQGLIRWDVLTPPEYVAAERVALEHLSQYGFISPWEKEYYRKDGSRIAILLGVALLPGTADQTIGIAVDISDRKAAELALQESEFQFRRLAENIPGMIYRYVVFPDGRDQFTYVSPRIREVYELEPAAVLQDAGALWARICPEDIPLIKLECAAAIQEQRSFCVEHRVLISEGQSKWVQTTSSPVRQANGEIISDGVVFDISDRKNIEAKLKQQLMAIEAAIDGIAILDGECATYLYTNQAYLHLFGYDCPTELLGASWRTMHPLAEVQRFDAEIYPAIAADSSWQGEAMGIRKDGSTFAQGLSLTLTDDGLLICVCRDITEQRAALHERQQTEMKLRATNEELIRATRLKDEFLANMSHELRTPLNAILGMTEGLQEQIFGRINAEQLEALQTIESSGTHLLELINDLLDVAKIESGQTELHCTSTAIAPLCQASLAFIQGFAQKKNIQLDSHIPTDLPDLWLDERRIRQVLINLLTNAVKFTPDRGHITFKVARATHPTLADILRFTVTDTGIGIALEDINKLFRPFEQINSALNRQHTGTGLGLTLVKRIVELHGGYVTVTSTQGVGSCFTVELPCAPCGTEPRPKADNNSQVLPENPAIAPKEPPLILLAEDNKANISAILPYLEVKGYRILLARDGQEAIDLAQSHTPNLILMDIQMPGMDGIEAIQHIRQVPALVEVPIIALTALAMASDRQNCLNAGATEYLSKPVRLKDLSQMMQSLLSVQA